MAIDGKPHGGLHQRGDDVEHTEGQAQRHIIHVQKSRQQRKERRQHHDVQVADKVRCGDLRQQADTYRHGETCRGMS